VRVYPNPVIDQLLIETSNCHQAGELMIYDLFGHEISRHTVTGARIVVSLRNLDPGIYIVKFAKQGIIRKIVKL